MNYILKMKEWGNYHHRSWMDPMRMAFGISLLLKGLYYIYYSDYITRWLQSGLFLKEAGGIISIILAFLHIFLGLFILLGILTRFASAVLVPVLFTSSVYANVESIHFIGILFTVAALILCIFFTIEGSGRFSLYAYMSNPDKSPENMTTDMHEDKI